jgi:hypothetical protein
MPEKEHDLTEIITKLLQTGHFTRPEILRIHLNPVITISVYATPRL